MATGASANSTTAPTAILPCQGQRCSSRPAASPGLPAARPYRCPTSPGRVAAADGHVWLVGLDGLVRDVVDGAQLWSRDPGAPIGSPATIADGPLLASAGDGTIHALELTTGTERWAVVVSGDRGPVSVADGRVALATSTGLLSLLGPSPNASP